MDGLGNRKLETLQKWNGSAWVTESETENVYTTRCHVDKVIRGKNGPQPSTTEYCYDLNNNLEKVWDANHERAANPNAYSLYSYDPRNRLKSVTQPWGPTAAACNPPSPSDPDCQVTQYEYDVQDHLKRVTDGEGNITTYETGDRDLLTKETSPVFSGATPFRTFAYNAHGALVTETDPRGIVAARTVDDLDRVTLIDYADNTLDTVFTYDGSASLFQKGRLTSINRAAGASVVNYGYDRYGRMLQDGALVYEYDQNGNRTRITYPGGVVADYTHDFADREATLTVTGGGLGATSVASGAVYKASGPLSSLTLGNGIAETRLFDARYFPDRIQAGALLDWDYTVDQVGNPTAISGTVLPGVSYAPAFAYQDHQYFLTQGNGPWGNRTWTYDKIGNRVTFARSSEPTQTYAYASPGHNPKLSTITPSPGWGTGAWSFSYDAAGNQTSIAESNDEGAVQTIVYDFAGDSRLNAMRTASPLARPEPTSSTTAAASCAKRT